MSYTDDLKTQRTSLTEELLTLFKVIQPIPGSVVYYK